MTTTDPYHPLVIDVNVAYEALVGYSRNELIGRSLIELGIAIPGVARTQRLEQLDKKSRYYLREGSICARDGRIMNVLISAQRTTYEGQECDIESLIDLTQLRKTEAALRRSEVERAAIIDQVRELIIQLNTDYLLEYVSPASHEVIGSSPENLVGHFAHEFVHPDDYPLVIARLNNIFNGGDSNLLLEFRLRHANGQIVWVEASGAPIYGSGGKVEHLISVLRDISERKQIEHLHSEQERLQIALQKEIEMNELKARMMGRISHEFRTPLATILQSASMIDRYDDRLTSEARHTKLQQIYAQVHHLTQLLDTISLIVSRRSNLLIADRIEFDLDQMCREQLSAIHERELQHVHFEHELHQLIYTPDVEIHSFYGDPNLFRSMLHQLIGNAVRYSRLGTRIWLNVNSVFHDDVELVEIAVRDEGFGILPRDLPHIFEPFFRGSSIEESSGIGVGLSLVQDAVDAHEGTISVESTPNVGSTFTITIPNRRPT